MLKKSSIKQIFRGTPSVDGAGVRLVRIFGFYEEGQLDPFLLLDYFGSDDPDDYIAGFPWHPHRGIETVTYILEGKVEHSDSMGNKGSISSGDIQWMTAGSGIIHQEMPKPDGNRMYGFQLWVNLPKKDKMMKPRYQDVLSSSIPETKIGNTKIRVITGSYNGIDGAVTQIANSPVYLDVDVQAGDEFSYPIPDGNTFFSFVFEGEGYFGENHEKVSALNGCLFDSTGEFIVSTKMEHCRFILLSGKPLKEPIAWRGPIVMNTLDELNTAFKEFREGTFIK